MNLNFTDNTTREFVNGLLLILNLYPKAKVRSGYGDYEVTIRDVNGILPDTTKKILEDWGWQLMFYEDSYFWEYEL